jgi:hypothetical protein
MLHHLDFSRVGSGYILRREGSPCRFFAVKIFGGVQNLLSEVVGDGSVDEVLFGLRQFASFA